MDTSAGTPVAICEPPAAFGGDWGTDGNIVFGAGPSGLHRVRASGGTPVQLTKPDPGRGETAHRWPQLLPGGRVLFQVAGTAASADIYAASLANPKDAVRLVDSSGGGTYASGHLLWVRGTALVAQRFDPGRLQLSGEPVPVADRVGADPVARHMAVSGNLLAFSRPSGEQLTWLERSGKPVATVGEPGEIGSFRTSSDGRRLALTRASAGAGADLWTVDLGRGAWSRLTSGLVNTGFPVWSPDGEQVLFRAGTPLNLWRKQANGGGWRSG